MANLGYAAESRFNSLPGLIFEAEDWTEPRSAWLTNKVTDNLWRLWTTEGPGKRSRDASLVSPVIKQDRATPQDGAPVLHTRITKIPVGIYQAWLGPTTRPLAYSQDGGKTWLKNTSGETDLGVQEIKSGTFELWVDDRYSNPASFGSAYYDYIRLVPFTPPQISNLASFTLTDGRVQISWITDRPAPPAKLTYGNRVFTEGETGQRNHRIVLDGVAAQAPQTATLSGSGYTPVEVNIAVRLKPVLNTQAQVIELTVTEPTEFPRTNWPVTFGLPFAQGKYAGTGIAQVTAPKQGGKQMVQPKPVAYWPDGSVKWVWFTFSATTQGRGNPTPYQLELNPASPPPTPAQTITIQEDGDSLRINNGLLSLRCQKKQFALFDELTLAGSKISGNPIGGNGRIVDVGGTNWMMATEGVVVEETGGQRAVIRAEGDFVNASGIKGFRWRARYFIYAGQPWMRLSWTLGNNLTNQSLTRIASAGVRVPFAAGSAMQGSLNQEAQAPVKDETSRWLLQDKDDRFSWSGGSMVQTGRQASGCALVRDNRHQLTVTVKDFWQTYPKGFALKPDGIHVRVLPPLPRDAYAQESQNDENLIRLYYCYDQGQYLFKRGLEFTTDMYVRCDQAQLAPSAEVQEAWFQNPLFAVATPDYYCQSGVFGFVEPRQAGRFDAYEKVVETGFSNLEKNRLTKHEYGWMNYGDWHGERHFNWGNHEYDLMGALALQFIRTGDLKYLWRADQASFHSTSIDTVHYPWSARMAGRVYTHSVGHVGDFFDKVDSRFRRLGNVFGLRDASQPNPFVAGAIDTGGHIYQPGNFRLGFLLAERRYLEVAEMVCAAQAAYFTANFKFGIERAAGWPLMNAVAAYEATGNPFYLNAARLYVEKIVTTQTERGDWNLPHGPPECLHTPPHSGGKAFATGILLNGMMMYDQVAPSPEAKRCIVRSAHWLEKYAYNKQTHGYRYIDTCPTYEQAKGSGFTDLLVSSGLAYACTLDPDPALKTLLLDSLSRSMVTQPKEGKSYAQCIRQTPHALAIMHQKLGVEELPVTGK